MKRIIIGHLYPDELNLYGDRGNIEALVYRGAKMGVVLDVMEFVVRTKGASFFFGKAVILFMGGGPDSLQKEITEDFLREKGPFVKEYFNKGGVGLFICGAYQLLGKYYKPFFGDPILGLGIADFYTEHLGRDFPRCVGNIIVDISTTKIPTGFSKFLVGFENHGGRTFLGQDLTPLGKVVMGSGNNGKEKREGIFLKNFIGTYLHGPILPKNPHLTDFLLMTALRKKGYTNRLKEPLYDRIEILTHQAALKLKR